MKRSNFPLIGAIVTMICCGSTAPPDSAANGVVDRVFEAIKRGTLPPSDLRILEHAAEGKFEESDVAVAISLGISRADFSPLAFASEGARVHALRKIGEIGLPEAALYLSGISLANIGRDISQQVWPAARIALHVARVNGISDRDAKLVLLRSALTEKTSEYADGAVQYWALNELCDCGDYESLPAVKEWLKRAYAGSPVEQELERFCEARMQIVTRDPDRVRSVASVLRLDGSPPNIKLISWAVSELDAVHSPAAMLELARFGEEVARLPQTSSAKQMLLGIQDRITRILSQNTR